MFCHLWYRNASEAVISEINVKIPLCVMEVQEANYSPYLFSCSLPEEIKEEIPVAVSLVEHQCEHATNILKVEFNNLNQTEEKGNFAVCVKGTK